MLRRANKTMMGKVLWKQAATAIAVIVGMPVVAYIGMSRGQRRGSSGGRFSRALFAALLRLRPLPKRAFSLP